MSLFTISKEELLKRLKSFGWRAGMMILSVLIAFVLDNLKVLNLSPAIIGILGLILGEVSKILNKNLISIKAMAGKKDLE